MWISGEGMFFARQADTRILVLPQGMTRSFLRSIGPRSSDAWPERSGDYDF